MTIQDTPVAKDFATLQRELDEALQLLARSKEFETALRAEKLKLAGEAVCAKESEKQARLQFDDLKSRLHDAEMENARMRGYIARCQEDDTVREELVTVGGEDEKQLVPKRKATSFAAPAYVSETGEPDSRFLHGFNNEPRRKPKHWVIY